MKRVFCFLTILFWCLPLHAQLRPGNVELSLSLAAGSLAARTEVSGEGRETATSESSRLYAHLFARPGIFITKGLEFEPELQWTAVEGVEPAVALSGNLAYNFVIPRSRLVLFLLAGYGVSNGIPTFGHLAGRMTDALDITLINAGAGMKVFIVRQAALRMEYRFQRYRYSYDETVADEVSYNVLNTWTYHNFLLGFSVFFQ